LYTKKEDYKKWTSLCSSARKKYYGEWRPNTLTDSGRELKYSLGTISELGQLKHLHNRVEVRTSVLSSAGRIPLVLYEAATCDSQFDYLAGDFDRAALRGDASIPHKYDIAQQIDFLAHKYGKPVHILYFGDYDKKGLEILDSLLVDLELWCSTKFTCERMGITLEQVAKYDIPRKEDSDSYEWEALSAEAAQEIVHGALNECVDLDLIEQAKAEDIRKSENLRARVKASLAPLTLEYAQAA